MDKEFVPYEESLALKELGFDEPCFGRFNPDGDLVVAHTEKYVIINGVNRKEFFTLAPTFRQAFRWFREKYELLGTPLYFTNGFYCFTINDMQNTEKSNRLFTEFDTYPDAELACLIKLIEIVKR
jgi:hypothetical protein